MGARDFSKSSLFLFLSFVGVGCTTRGASPRDPASSAPTLCSENLTELVNAARVKRAEFRAVFTARAGVLNKILKGTRDKMRHQLQIFNNHPYPVIAMDDSPLAYGWARSAYGALTAEQEALLKKDEIWTSLREEFARLKAFPATIETLTQKAVDLTLQIGGIEAFLKKPGASFHSIQLEVPTLVGEEIGTSVRYFGSLTKMEIELKNLKADLASLRKQGMELSVNQAIGVRRLETYRHELLGAKSEFKNAEPPEDYRQMLADIESLYTDSSATLLKTEFRPSDQAWNTVKWKQWRAEIQAFFVKRLPQEKAVEKSKEIIAFIKTLNESELRALGLHDVATDVKLFGRARYVRLVGATITGAGGLSAPVVAIKLVKDYFSDGQACVESKTEDEFYDCLDEYIRSEHPGKYTLKKQDLENALVSGELIDPEILATAERMLDRRMTYFLEKNVESELSSSTRRQLARLNMLSEEFRMRLISETNEAWFKDRLLNADPKSGYLALKFPLIYRQSAVQRIVIGALEGETLERRKTLLVELETMPAAKDMRTELLDILENRDRYQAQYRAAQSLKEKMREELSAKLKLDKLEIP
jgi:hypothetical protein